MPLHLGFCTDALREEGILVLPNLADEPELAKNPLVTGEPHLRFYAGAPLQLPGGERVGTLCLADRRPRALDAVDLAILGSLRDLVVEELVQRTEAR